VSASIRLAEIDRKGRGAYLRGCEYAVVERITEADAQPLFLELQVYWQVIFADADLFEDVAVLNWVVGSKLDCRAGKVSRCSDEIKESSPPT
jgi:hypothetical protein